VYQYAQRDGEIKKYQTYYCNLVKWNARRHPHNHHANPFYEFLYDPATAYGIDRHRFLSTSVFKELANRISILSKGHNNLREKFFSNLVSGVKDLVMPKL
jgi:hypothetical protein